MSLAASGGRAAGRSVGGDSPAGLARSGAAPARPARQGVLRIGLAGANPRARVTPAARLPGKVNYMIGNNRSDWRTGIPTYGAVRYRDVWPGVGARFYGRDGQLEYDFDVAAGADPGRIALNVSGDQGVTVRRDGSLLLKLPGGHVRQLVPRAYQQTPGGRRSVSARYQLHPGGRVTIGLGRYDHRLPLVVDPVLLYVSYLGGSADDEGHGVSTIPGSGGAWVTGISSSADFPVTADAAQPRPGDPSALLNYGDAFVARLNDADQLTYVSYLGGNTQDAATAISVTPSGGAWVTGVTNSTNFPVTANAAQSSNPTPFPSNDFSGFVVKLNADGTVAYASYLGGSGIEVANGISATAGGGAWVTGYTYSGNFPVTADAAQGSNPAPGGGRSGFVVKLNANGSVAYASYLGGSSGNDSGNGVSTTPDGGAWVTGYTYSTDFPVTADAQDASGNTSGKGFVVKLNAGGAVAYASYLGGSVVDQAQGISATPDGGAWVSGATASPDFPVTADAVQDTFSGPAAAFAVKLNPNGTIAYGTYLGGNDIDIGYAISVTPSGGAWVAGTTTSPIDFPVTANAGQDTLTGQAGFAVKLNPNGTIAYGTYLGGNGTDFALAISATAVGGAWITGLTTSDADFPVTANAAQSTFAGGTEDAFVARIGESIAITKTASVGHVAPGGTVTYTLRVLNRTGGTISGAAAQVSDDLSHVLDSATWAGNAHASSGTVSFDAAAKQLHWTGTLAAGATATITYSVHVRSGLTGGLLTNAADSPTGAICMGAPSAQTPCTTVTPIVPPTPTPSQPAPAGRPDLLLTKTASVSQAHPGDQIGYQLVVRNRGNAAATGVVIRDAIPPGLQITRAVPGQGTCHTGAMLTCTLGTIRAGGEALVQLTATISLTATGAIVNVANVSSDQVSAHPADGTSTSRVGIVAADPDRPAVVQPVSDLVVTGGASHSRVRRGQRVLYTFTVTNHGPHAAHNARVRFAFGLPARVISALTSRGSCTRQRPVVCTIDTIPAHGHVTIRIRTQETVAGHQRVSACADSSSHDPHPSTAVARLDLRVQPVPDITVVAVPATIHPGQTSLLHIHIANVNRITLTRLSTCVTLPAGLAYTGPDRTATTTGHRRCWSLDRLRNGDTHAYIARVRPTATAAAAIRRLAATARHRRLAASGPHPIPATVSALHAVTAHDRTHITITPTPAVTG